MWVRPLGNQWNNYYITIIAGQQYREWRISEILLDKSMLLYLSFYLNHVRKRERVVSIYDLAYGV